MHARCYLLLVCYQWQRAWLWASCGVRCMISASGVLYPLFVTRVGPSRVPVFCFCGERDMPLPKSQTSTQTQTQTRAWDARALWPMPTPKPMPLASHPSAFPRGGAMRPHSQASKDLSPVRVPWLIAYRRLIFWTNPPWSHSIHPPVPITTIPPPRRRIQKQWPRSGFPEASTGHSGAQFAGAGPALNRGGPLRR